MKLSDPVSSLKGVGPQIQQKLGVLRIETLQDLIFYFPRKYEDYSTIVTSDQLRPGQKATLKATLGQVKGRYVRRGMHITEAVATDVKGSIKLVWFNQPYRVAGIKTGQEYLISGDFALSRGRMNMVNPSLELNSNFPLHSARIISIYKETAGLKSAALRKLVDQVRPLIDRLPETLPEDMLEQNDLISFSRAVEIIHYPESMQQLETARRRFGFEELVGVMIASELNKRQFKTESGVTIPFNESLVKEFVANLPFPLTSAQRKVAWKIFMDMEAKEPMNRLVEGDVGSGKTLVAVMAAIVALDAGYQVAMMAPTEILARQHFVNVASLVKGKSTELLLGSMKAAEKKRAHQRIAAGESRFIIGTHALITDKVAMDNLGLVIIDEQHRFGVKQRKFLQSKAGKMPHVLSMTATPIPRTLALTIYGELDISIIDELPPGRSPIVTQIVSPNSRTEMYSVAHAQLAAGHQVFVVCPLIEESDTINVASVDKIYNELSKKVFKGHVVSLLHGKMPNDEKESIMARFIAKEIDVLVSTTVIEVGVDVPNATVMIIEGSERFGLAQLHQLRGRVGRGRSQGFCFLVMSDSKTPPKRLQAMEYTTDGFKLAELDLDIRGPGAIYGISQSGQLDLRFANIADHSLVSGARKVAVEFVATKQRLDSFPVLKKRVQRYRSITNLN